MGKRFLIWSNPRDALVHLTYFLMLLGGVNIFSASFVAAGDMFGNGYHYLIRYFIYGAVGLVLMHWIGRNGTTTRSSGIIRFSAPAARPFSSPWIFSARASKVPSAG